MTLRGGSVRLCPRTPARPSVGVEKRLGVAGVPELGGPGLPGSRGEAGCAKPPAGRRKGLTPARRTATPRRPQQCIWGRGPGPGIGGPARGRAPLPRPLPRRPARARSPRCSLEPGCLGLCEQLFKGSFAVRRGAGTSAPSPSADFQNTGVKNTPSLPPQAREGRLGGTRQPRPPPH